MQPIKTTSQAQTRIRKRNKLSKFIWTSTKVLFIEELTLVTVGQWAKSSREYPRFSLLWLIYCIQLVTGSTSPDMRTIPHPILYCIFAEIMRNIRRKKLQGNNQGSNFTGGIFDNRDNVRSPIQFRREKQYQNPRRWFFLLKIPIHF